MTRRVRIDRLGQRGDGIAETPEGTVIVPGGLPGEQIDLADTGTPQAFYRPGAPGLVVSSPDRVDPPCPLFGHCGGCATQHVGPDLYGQWKRGLVVSALAQAGLEAPVEPLVPAHGAGRRRVVFHARRSEAGIAVGFMEAASHALVPVPACPLLVPGLARAPTAALELARALASPKPLDIQLTATTAGMDVDIRGHGPVEGRRRAVLTAVAGELDLARLSVHGDIVVERRPPLVEISGVPVLPPPGGFLQATEAGERALTDLVASAAAKARTAVDLFSGIGPFALRLARTMPVHAVEHAEPALAALDRAARHADGLRPVTTEARDLFRRPLFAADLDRFGVVVFDPPRAGAQAQVRELARTRDVPLAIAVSCNPASFARDARLLVDGGWLLSRVTPVDQFLYSSHVELVGLFERPRAARPRRFLG